MLDLLIYTFNFIRDVSYFGFVLSYKTGQLIIYCLNIVFEILMQINKNVGTLLRILLEDFYVFLCDVGQRIVNIGTFISSVFQTIMNFINTIIESIKLIFSGIAFILTVINNGAFGGIFKILSGIGQAFVAIKQFIVLIGASIWFTVTLIPLCIIYICTMSTYYLGCLLDEITKFIIDGITSCRNLISNFYEFVTDVPVESVAGLITGACIIHNIHRLRTRLLTRFRRRLVQQQLSSESEETESSGESSQESDMDCSSGNENRMCIICQERNKCILMLPCRHVCLCSVCNSRLRNYNRSCPICRGFVERTMKVFV
ncbi:hypothetical protein ILUMI_27102 [Ignelater luminosus]|uniref:RING-type domain-containing protein n=1 Tax=Ignelater luminosus TaxID=2038154 RepID=A0A8K0C769_IGNLU|nr:hypothetical protein ILUMI_27102 [Ignelater luminosus]